MDITSCMGELGKLAFNQVLGERARGRGTCVWISALFGVSSVPQRSKAEEELSPVPRMAL